jgi:hypothetical protein
MSTLGHDARTWQQLGRVGWGRRRNSGRMGRRPKRLLACLEGRLPAQCLCAARAAPAPAIPVRLTAARCSRRRSPPLSDSTFWNCRFRGNPRRSRSTSGGCLGMPSAPPGPPPPPPPPERVTPSGSAAASSRSSAALGPARGASAKVRICVGGGAGGQGFAARPKLRSGAAPLPHTQPALHHLNPVHFAASFGPPLLAHSRSPPAAARGPPAGGAA